MYKALTGMIQQAYQSKVAPVLGAVALGAGLGGCAAYTAHVIEPNNKPEHHNVSQWKGIPTVQKYDATLAKTMAGRKDWMVASNDLTAYCREDEKKVQLCYDLIKQGHASTTFDGLRGIGTIGAIMLIHAATSGSGAASAGAAKGKSF